MARSKGLPALAHPTLRPNTACPPTRGDEHAEDLAVDAELRHLVPHQPRPRQLLLLALLPLLAAPLRLAQVLEHAARAGRARAAAHGAEA